LLYVLALDKELPNMEIKSFIIGGDLNIFSNFHKNLESCGYENVCAKAIRQTCSDLKQILNVDLLKQNPFEKVLASSRSLLLVNPQVKGVIMLKGSTTRRRPEESPSFLVVCGSDTQENVEALGKTLMEILVEKIGLRREAIHEGDFDENANRRCISNLSETQRTELLREVKMDTLRVFTEGNARMLLRELVNFPYRVFREDLFVKDRLGELDLNLMTSSGIFDELFSPTCRKCKEEITISPSLFVSKDDIEPMLEKKTLVCPSCGSKLGADNTTVMRYLKFSKLGLEMAKGLWLEAYIDSLLAEIGIPRASAIACALHGKDELDLVFSDGRFLYVCECKDRTVGQNDIYVLAMKASRISTDRKIRASVDRILIISTELISKDVMPDERTEESRGEIEYIAIGGEPSLIKERLSKIIDESRKMQKKRSIRDIFEIVALGLSPEEREYIAYRQHEYIDVDSISPPIDKTLDKTVKTPLNNATKNQRTVKT
jgi:DNA-directed RNA polymerase subunit RPC12/RpoP